MSATIQIIVNGFQEEVPKNVTLADLIDHFQERDTHLIVEHNGKFVYPDQYEKVVVSEGDRVEFINPSFGG
jgi:thiamine biosynthesis protein ThiS